MKLELKHLAPYLPYRLELETSNGIISMDALNDNDEVRYHIGFFGDNDHYIPEVKPILRPLSSITKEEAKEFLELIFNTDCFDDGEVVIKTYPHYIMVKYGSSLICSVYLADFKVKCFNGNEPIFTGNSVRGWLFEHHFDVFNLISKGLAIDKNTI